MLISAIIVASWIVKAFATRRRKGLVLRPREVSCFLQALPVLYPKELVLHRVTESSSLIIPPLLLV